MIKKLLFTACLFLIGITMGATYNFMANGGELSSILTIFSPTTSSPEPISLPQPDISAIKMNELQPQLTTQPCYFSAKSTCLLFYRSRTANTGYVTAMLGRKEIQKPEDASFSLGVLLATPDSIKNYYTKDANRDDYFKFIKQIFTESTAPNINPVFVYNYYDRYLNLYPDQAPHPISPFIYMLGSAAQIYSGQDLLDDEISQKISKLNWTPENKALLHAMVLTHGNMDNISDFFASELELHNFQLKRVNEADWANTLQFEFNNQPVTQEEYFSDNYLQDSSVAVCRNGAGWLCKASQVIDEQEIQPLTCSPATFFTKFCDGSLINIE